ncbi:hypothetical protein SS50377_21097 [Spironucleus salmonicida]|uniref:Uncharacterized protein n=2 Tax=Spironucleus TaxID=39709 RepID=V6LSV5_9EUKA|nr:hypothetical protein [Spironucleus barkhanus]KAH0577743.1 hypothetical protein SS50377_21097 [Spironucleus salmonicida]|eukprot:EST43879.1 Hypothetical protein SS50377_16179 [Spironucleus salmonicida]
MSQQIGDPSHFVQTISTQGMHTPFSLNYSPDTSLFGVGCEHGIIFIYDIPLLSIRAVYQVECDQEVTNIFFSPCNEFAFIFQLFDIDSGEFKLVITQIRLKSTQEFRNKIPLIQPAIKIFVHYINNVYIFKILPSQFRYTDNKLTGFEFLLHTYDDILLISTNTDEKVQIYSIFEHSAPFIPQLATKNIQDISLIYSKYLIIHLSNLLLIFTRNYRIPELTFNFSSIFSINGSKFCLEQVLNTSQSVPTLQSFVVFELQNTTANFYHSFKFMKEKTHFHFELPQNFLVLHDELLQFYIMTTVEYEAQELAQISHQLHFYKPISGDNKISPKPFPRFIQTATNAENLDFAFFFSSKTLSFYHFQQLNSPIVNPLHISLFKDRYVIISRRSVTAIPVSETEKEYEVHVLDTPISSVAIGVSDVGMHSSMVCCGEFQANLVETSVSVRRKLKYFDQDFPQNVYQPKKRQNVVLLGLPIRYTQFNAFFTGFQTVGQHVLYLEREDEYDFEEDFVLYPKGTVQQRSIERIKRQVEGLKGYYEELIEDGEHIDLGF